MSKAKKPDTIERLGTADDLPLEHVPRELRPPGKEERDRVEYACGYETVWKGDNPRASYAMWAGPFPALADALDCVPPRDSIEAIAKKETAVVVRFNLDGSDEVIYRWKVKTGSPSCWKRA